MGHSLKLAWSYFVEAKFMYQESIQSSWGVNQGCGLLSARGLEKRQSVGLVNTPKKMECSLRIIYHNVAKCFCLTAFWQLSKTYLLTTALQCTGRRKKLIDEALRYHR